MVFPYLYVICSALSKIETHKLSPVRSILSLETKSTYCLPASSKQSRVTASAHELRPRGTSTTEWEVKDRIIKQQTQDRYPPKKDSSIPSSNYTISIKIVENLQGGGKTTSTPSTPTQLCVYMYFAFRTLLFFFFLIEV